MPHQFSYQALPLERIRVLSLRLQDGTLFGTLEHVSLDESSQYTALSYCWGTDKARQSFMCNDHYLLVSQTLFSALMQIAYQIPGENVWIDAICIDQSNDKEKAIQVNLMDRIYARAAQVVVWLGEAEGMPGPLNSGIMQTAKRDLENSDLAMEKIPALATSMRILAPQEILIEDKLIAYGLPPADDRVWHSIRGLISRPWFSRLWVVQEVLLAKSVMVWCGSKALNFRMLSFFCFQVNRLDLKSFVNDRFGLSDVGFRFLLGMPVLHNTLSSTRRLSVSSFMNISREKNVTEPIDRVYGLLGMLGQMSKMIEVDYSQQSRENYWHSFIDIFKCYMSVDPDLGLLSHAPSQWRQQSLPSWVPNLASPAAHHNNFDNAGYRAGISLSNSHLCKPSIVVEPETNYLHVSGFELDRVNKIVEPVYFHTSVADNETAQAEMLTRIDRWENECRALSAETYHLNTNNTHEAHWRGLIADVPPMLGKNFPAGPDLGDAYNAYLWMVGLSMSADNEQTPNAMMTPEWQQSQLWRGQKFVSGMTKWADHSYFSTTGGRTGRGPKSIQSGDILCIFYSGAPVFALRYEHGRNFATLIGDCYVYGCMDFDLLPREVLREEEMFVIG